VWRHGGAWGLLGVGDAGLCGGWLYHRFLPVSSDDTDDHHHHDDDNGPADDPPVPFSATGHDQPAATGTGAGASPDDDNDHALLHRELRQ
jgi:hypothetical protein